MKRHHAEEDVNSHRHHRRDEPSFVRNDWRPDISNKRKQKKRNEETIVHRSTPNANSELLALDVKRAMVDLVADGGEERVQERTDRVIARRQKRSKDDPCTPGCDKQKNDDVSLLWGFHRRKKLSQYRDN